MTEQESDLSPEGITYDGIMRLSWMPRVDSPEAGYPAESARNERLLRALLLFQESHCELAEEPGERITDLLRIEAKLDLLFDLVARLIPEALDSDEACPVQLWMTGVRWDTTADQLPKVGEPLWLLLYLDSGIPQPLRLPVRVTGVARETTGGRVTARLELLGEPLEDLIGRLIFRQHRRMIAQQKAQQQTGEDS